MGDCLKPTMVDLESQGVYYSQGNINNKDACVKFIGPEFDNVFHIICQKQKKVYYQVRQLSKKHQSVFENYLKSYIDQIFIKYENLTSFVESQFFNNVKNLKVVVQYENLAHFVKSRYFGGYENLKVVVQYQDLRDFVNSEFSSRVKYLNVIVELRYIYDNHLNDLSYISTNYLPNNIQINVIFQNTQAPRYPTHEFIHVRISLNQSLIFRGVNFVCENKENLFQKQLQLQIYCGYFNNIEILNCNFDSVNLDLSSANKVTILNSSFKNVAYNNNNNNSKNRFALNIQNTKNQLIMEDIEILNCANGVQIYDCIKYHPIINNLKIQNFSGIGCKFQSIKGASLSNANIVGGKTGIYFSQSNNVKISDCTIKDFTCYSIEMYNSIVNYKRTYFERGDLEPIQNNIYDSVRVDEDSVFDRIL